MKSIISQCVVIGSVLVWGPVAEAQEPSVMTFNPMNIEFMSEPVAFDNEPVTGAPYSAEAVTEVVQTLADGNRIVRESKAQISRDDKGRTRREQGLAMFGPLVGDFSSGNEPRHVQISDPTTKTTTLLDLQSKSAHRIPAPNFRIAKADHFEVPPPPPPPGGGAVGWSVSRRAFAGVAAAKPVIESLGNQVMEGLPVEGTRATTTIPVGQIGNEQPIQITYERWWSPDLKVLVSSRQSDPRFGETTYRLTNITRGEPAPDLFEIPPDFKLLEPGRNRDVIIERKIVK